jgi:hypothetical protein
VREAAEVEGVAEAPGAGFEPLVAAGAHDEGVALGDLAHRRLHECQCHRGLAHVVLRHLEAQARVGAAGPVERAQREQANLEA